MEWKNFEYEAFIYLKTKYGGFFKLNGESDSTQSDIIYENRSEKFYIEVKMPVAQSGQFVLIEDKINKQFFYSCKNKTEVNPYSTAIIDYINLNYQYYSDVNSAGKEIILDKDIFYNWIVRHYEKKNVRFFITRYNDKFLLFHIKDFSKYFNVKAIFRLKKSGSRHITENDKIILKEILKYNINFHFEGTNIISNYNLDRKKIQNEEKTYYFRKIDINKYSVTKLSNTNNANVIFSIELHKELKQEINHVAKENLKIPKLKL